MLKRLIVWTYVTNHFIMGGKKNRPTGTEVDITDAEKINLGKGYYGYEIKTPKGDVIVIEANTGAIIGNDIKTVKQDIDEADESVMASQIEKANIEMQKVQVMDNFRFWNMYHKSLKQ